MKKLSMIMYLFVFAALILSSCRLGFGFNTDVNPEINIEPNVNPEISLTFTILREAEVYSELSMDADQIAVLPVGTQVEPADGNTSLECEPITDEGATYSLCKIEVVDSGAIGWVLEETLSE
jgi:hypothetical protein